MLGYSIEPARYVKGKLLVRFAKEESGLMARAQRILAKGLNCRYTGREMGLVASPSQVRRFEQLYAGGWDACTYSGALLGPNGERVENRSRRWPKRGVQV